MYKKTIYYFLILLLSLTACNLETKTANSEIKQTPALTMAEKPEFVIEQKIQTSAVEVQPIQTASIIKLEPIQTVSAIKLEPVAIIEPQKIIIKKPEVRDAWWYIKNSNEIQMPKLSKYKSQLNWYAKHPSYLDRVAKRAQPYLYYILKELEKNDLPLELALLPIVESGYQSFAYSHGSAAGLWQFIPSTGRLYGLKQNWWYDGRRDAIKSTQAAVKLLKRLGKKYKGDWLLALAAYNWGPGNVNKAIRKNKKRGKKTGFWDIKLPAETKSYVPKLLALKELITNQKKYDLKLYSIPYKEQVQLVDAKSQIDLALVAKLADIPIDTVYRYNSGFNRWSTPPKGPHKILLPIESAIKLQQGLKNTPKNQMVTWKRHKIKNGETLSHIANKYHTTVSQIRALNNIRKSNIRAGKHIIVPVAGKKMNRYALSAQQRLNIIKATQRSGKKTKVKVKQGDTFWDISRAHKVSIKDLAKWNGLAPKDSLKIGQTLVIWKKTSNYSVKQTLLSNVAFKNIKTTRKINYSVRRGDSLARIADKFHVSIYDLKKWNVKVRNKKYIQPGQKLNVYIDIRKQSG